MPGILLAVAALTVIDILFLRYWKKEKLQRCSATPTAGDLLIENTKDIVLYTDSFDKVTDVNPSAVHFLAAYGGRAGKESYIGRPIAEVFSFLPGFSAGQKDGEKIREQRTCLQREEKTKYYKIYTTAMADEENPSAGNLYILHDITPEQEELNRMEQTNEIRLITERIFDVTVEGIVVTDSRGGILRANEAFEKMSGYTEKEMLGKNPRIFKSGKQGKRFYSEMWRSILENGYWEGEIWDRKKNGDLYPKHMSISALKKSKDEVENYIAVSVDISDLKAAEQKLYTLAYFDFLTGIPNRRLFYEKVSRAITHSIKKSRKIAVLLMDLDGFKLINDSLGHSAGDLALQEVAERIKTCIGDLDVVARIDGDEFAVMLENIPDIAYVEQTIQKIMQTIRMPYHIEEREITLGVSTGIAIAPDDEAEAEGLIRKADAAMYAAKEAGKGIYSFTSEEIEKRNRELLEMQLKLKEAIKNEEFLLYLQPQISYEDGKLCLAGAEALIRWRLPDNQMCPPDKFIPIAESNGMIVPIGEWVFDEILRINEKLRENDIEIKLAINVSTRQLETDSFINKIKNHPEILEKNIILELEITESFLLADFDSALAMLKRIHNMGVYIALDDFGTGFSSLSYLTRLPIDYLKIDKSFIDDIAVADNKSIVPNIIAMAKKLNMRTIAEGVETKEQVDCLFKQKCDEIQGYYFGRPMDLETFIQFAKDFERQTENELQSKG